MLLKSEKNDLRFSFQAMILVGQNEEHLYFYEFHLHHFPVFFVDF